MYSTTCGNVRHSTASVPPGSPLRFETGARLRGGIGGGGLARADAKLPNRCSTQKMEDVRGFVKLAKAWLSHQSVSRWHKGQLHLMATGPGTT